MDATTDMEDRSERSKVNKELRVLRNRVGGKHRSMSKLSEDKRCISSVSTG